MGVTCPHPCWTTTGIESGEPIPVKRVRRLLIMLFWRARSHAGQKHVRGDKLIHAVGIFRILIAAVEHNCISAAFGESVSPAVIVRWLAAADLHKAQRATVDWFRKINRP